MRHHVKQHATRLSRIMHRYDVRVGQARDCFDLLKKSFGAERRRDVRVQDLDRDASVVPRVTRAVYSSHPTSTNLELDGIAVAECFLRSGCGQ